MRGPLVAAAGAGFVVSTLGGYLLALWISLFGFQEVRTTAGIVAGVIEVAAFAVLAVLALSAGQAQAGQAHAGGQRARREGAAAGHRRRRGGRPLPGRHRDRRVLLLRRSRAERGQVCAAVHGPHPAARVSRGRLVRDHGRRSRLRRVSGAIQRRRRRTAAHGRPAGRARRVDPHRLLPRLRHHRGRPHPGEPSHRGTRPGRTWASGRGSHQFGPPSSSITAATSTSLTSLPT